MTGYIETYSEFLNTVQKVESSADGIAPSDSGTTIGAAEKTMSICKFLTSRASVFQNLKALKSIYQVNSVFIVDEHIV